MIGTVDTISPTPVCTCVYSLSQTHTRTHTHTHTHTHTSHRHKHTRIHTHTCVCTHIERAHRWNISWETTQRCILTLHHTIIQTIKSQLRHAEESQNHLTIWQVVHDCWSLPCIHIVLTFSCRTYPAMLPWLLPIV